MNDIHECDFKKGKLVEAMSDSQGNFYCCRCFQFVPESQVDEKLLKRRRRR